MKMVGYQYSRRGAAHVQSLTTMAVHYPNVFLIENFNYSEGRENTCLNLLVLVKINFSL